MTDGASGLKKGVSLFDVVSLGLGTAVGVSIFSILAPTAQLAGPGMLLAMAAAMAPMILFAVIYAFMGSALPVSGASYEWPRRFISPFAGFFVSWLRIVGSAAALIVLATVLVSYLSSVLPMPGKLAMFGMFLFVYVLNTLGVSAAAKGQTLMLAILLLTCAVLVFGSFPKIAPSDFSPFLPMGWGGVLAAVPLMISLFLGIESATEVGEEVKNPGRNIPLGIAISVCLTALVYMAVAVAAIGVLGVEGLAASSAPLLDAARGALGEWGGALILVSATVAIGSSINAIFMIFSRYLYAMARSGILPSPLASVHARFGTPHVATTTAFGFCCLGLILPSDLIFLFLAVNIPTLLKYAAASISAERLIGKEPFIYEKAKFRPPRLLLRLLGYAGAAAAIGIILLGMKADWRPYALLGAWAAIGVVYYVIRSRMKPVAARDVQPVQG